MSSTGKTVLWIVVGVIVIVAILGFVHWERKGGSMTTQTGTSTQAGATTTESPAANPTGNPPGNSQSFPTITLSYINPTTINPQSYSYQMADYDAARNRVLFYPYGSITPPIGNSGVLLSYNVGSGKFTDPSSWTATDLSQVIGPDAVNFGGGFLDPQDTYAYLPTGTKGRGGTAQNNINHSAVAVQVNLAKEYANPNDPSAYSSIDLRNLPGIPNVGGFAGIFADGYAYFCPTIDDSDGLYHGILIRYNSSEPFANASSWQWFNMNNITTPADPDLGGMQSAAYVAPYVYLIPFANGNYKSVTPASKIVRYDTTKNFESASSYQVFDISTLPVPANLKNQLNGFTGGVVVGNELVLIPWGLRTSGLTNSVALEFDTTKALNDPSAWQYIDLTTVNPKAGGYQFGWLDKNGFVWFVPTHNYNITTGTPPFVVWNSKLPFNNASSWTSYANPQRIWSTGAAYDPTTNTAWFGPYGEPAGGTQVATITQLQENY